MLGSEHPGQEVPGAKPSTAAQLRELDSALQCKLGGGAEPRFTRRRLVLLVVLGAEPDRRQASALFLDERLGQLLSIEAQRS